jgi:hypothetical protein
LKDWTKHKREIVRQSQQRKSSLFLDGMTSKERWNNVDAFQTWRRHGVWKSDLYPHEVSVGSKIHGRPTGQIIIVPPTATTIPYGVVSTVGKKITDVPQLEPQPSYSCPPHALMNCGRLVTSWEQQKETVIPEHQNYQVRLSQFLKERSVQAEMEKPAVFIVCIARLWRRQVGVRLCFGSPADFAYLAKR